MKKTLFTVALMGMVLMSFGQKVGLGIKGSFTSTKITTDTKLHDAGNYTYSDFKSDFQGGYNFGVFARLGGKKVYLQPELLYSEVKGQTKFDVIRGVENPIMESQDVKINSVQVPLLLGVRLFDFKIASIRAFTGPAMSIVLNSSESKLRQKVIDGFKPDQLKNNIWDWQLGAGIDVANFVFDVRYAWGISDIAEGNYNFVNKGNTLTFSIGFKIL